MFREAIKKAIELRNVTQAKTATENGIRYQNLSSFLSGKRTMPLVDIEKLFDYLGIEVKVKTRHKMK